MALVKRIDKGSRLTATEHDDNLEWLNEGGIKTSTTITLGRGGGNSHAASGGAALSGPITIDMTDAKNMCGAIVKWNGSENPVINVSNGNADVTYPGNDSITATGDYDIIILYVENFGANGEIQVYIPKASSGGGTSDTTAPVLSSAVVEDASPSTLVLTYNEILDATSTPANGDFSVNDGAANAVTNVSVSSTTVTLTLTNAIDGGDTVTVSYTAGSNPIQDAAGNDAANLTTQSVTNNVVASAFDISTLPNIVLALDSNVPLPLDLSGNGHNVLTASGQTDPSNSGGLNVFDGVDGGSTTTLGTAVEIAGTSGDFFQIFEVSFPTFTVPITSYVKVGAGNADAFAIRSDGNFQINIGPYNNSTLDVATYFTPNVPQVVKLRRVSDVVSIKFGGGSWITLTISTSPSSAISVRDFGGNTTLAGRELAMSFGRYVAVGGDLTAQEEADATQWVEDGTP